MHLARFLIATCLIKRSLTIENKRISIRALPGEYLFKHKSQAHNGKHLLENQRHDKNLCDFILVALSIRNTSQVPVEGKSSMCLICMKYRIIILIIIIISLALGQILLSYIANTSGMHTHARTRMREHTHTHTAVAKVLVTFAPNRDGPLCWHS